MQGSKLKSRKKRAHLKKPPIDSPEGPEDDTNKHADGERGWGEDDVSCFGPDRPPASEVGNQGDEKEAAL